MVQFGAQVVKEAFTNQWTEEQLGNVLFLYLMKREFLKLLLTQQIQIFYMLRRINEEEVNGHILVEDQNLIFINQLMVVKHGKK